MRLRAEVEEDQMIEGRIRSFVVYDARLLLRS